jgi:hypothetical protein
MWVKKRKKSYFGFKLHTKEDCEFGLICALETTTASVHDSQIDLSKEGEVVYRDKGYFGAQPLGFDAMMKRGVRNHPIGLGYTQKQADFKKAISGGETIRHHQDCIQISQYHGDNDDPSSYKNGFCCHQFQYQLTSNFQTSRYCLAYATLFQKNRKKLKGFYAFSLENDWKYHT